MKSIQVYIESGKKRVFAGAVDWPGWQRSGKSEDAALEALMVYAPRYAKVLEGEAVDFQTPKDRSVFVIVERHGGDATTDFGAPTMIPDADTRAFDLKELERSKTILQACWDAFDQAVRRAEGRELRKGPRGGGRDVEKMIMHVIEADRAYLGKVGGKHKQNADASPTDEITRIRQAIFEAMDASARGELPEKGPRGGAMWPARYFVRRTAWHVLDHAWEIEDRLD